MSGAREARNPYIHWYHQHKTLVWGAAATAAALYATYKATSGSGSSECPGPAPGRPQRPQSQFQRLRNMLVNYSAAASTLAETAALVSNDLRSFLTSDASELPQSLRQLNKLLQAPELQDTVSTVTASVVRGAATATGMTSLASSTAPSALLDTIIEAVLSERGRGLIGMAVGVATRNATVAVCEFVERRMEAAVGASGGRGFGPKDFLDLLASDQGERVLTLLLTNSIRTAVTSYVDATTGYNMYDDLLSSIAKTEHRDALTDLMSRVTSTFCREIVLAYRRSAAMAAAAAAAPTVINHTVGGGASRYTHGSRDGSNSSSGAAAAAAGGGGSPAAVPSASSGPSAPAEAGTPASAASGGGGTDGAPAASAAVAAVSPTTAVASLQTLSFSGKQGNGQLLLCGQNGRLAAAAANQKANTAAAGGGGGNVSVNAVSGGGSLSLSRAMLGQASPPWLRQVVDLVRERDVRSLAVDVVMAASREATRGAVEGLMQGTGTGAGGSSRGACGVAGGGLLVLPPGGQLSAKLCVLASLALALCMYALSPRTLLL